MNDPLIRRANKLIVLSELQRQIYAQSGVPISRMTVGQNFLPIDLDPGFREWKEGDAWLFVGRLSEEKGILPLVKQWPAHHKLRVVGEGEKRLELSNAIGKRQIELLGLLPRAKVMKLMRHSIGLVFPSICYESSSLVYLEALAAGLPTVAFEPNIVSDRVRADGTGWVIKWDDDLSAVLDQASVTGMRLTKHCRHVFDRASTEAIYLQQASALYNEVSR